MKTTKSNTINIRTLVFTALMGTISTVLMFISVSAPFAPAFLRFDIAELPALFAGFFLGPASGCGVILIKILLKLITQGTDTAFVGELMNIIGSMSFVLTASLIYKFNRTKKGAIISLIVSSIFVSIVFIFINAYIAFPMYSNLYGMPMEAIVAMGTAVNPRITDVTTLMLYSVFPFNLIKHAITSGITYVIYKKAGAALRNIITPNVTVQNA